MNDRSKFRLPFYNNKGEFSHFEFISIGESLSAYNAGVMFHRGEYEQCTGLKDKNGNLIYEGDIIKCEIDVKHELSVVWDDGCFGVYVSLHDEFVRFYPLGNFSKYEWDVKNIEIIGNIHEQTEQKAVK